MNQKTTWIICMVALISVITGVSADFQRTIQLTFSAAPRIVSNRLLMESCTSRLAASGGPELPMVVRTFVFPSNTQIGDLVTVSMETGEVELAHPLPVLPAKPTVNGVVSGWTVRNPLSGQGGEYPNRWVQMDVRRGLNPEDMQPAVFVRIAVYPVRVSGTHARYLRSITLQLRGKETGMMTGTGEAALLVIAPEAFQDALTEFVDHKRNLGITVRLLSVESIEANASGRDLPEKIKHAIAAAWEENAIRYVLLAGDADVIPVRYTFHSNYGGMNDWQNLPSDLYYADLFDRNGAFCSWDANKNDVFGEYQNGDIDGCDLLPDVLIGRIPASAADELQGFLNKVIHYEDSISGNEEWINRIVLAAADTFTEMHGDRTGIPEGEVTKETIAAESLGGYDLVKLYETDRFEKTAELTTQNLSDAIENGALYVNFANHGWIQGWAFNGGFSNENALALTNYDRLPVVFGYACSTGVFDTENRESPGYGYDQCLAEAFVLNSNGGAVAYFGATRTAFAGGFGYGGHMGALGYIDRSFFKAVGAGGNNQGALYLASLVDLIVNKGVSDTADYITALEYEHFGDPSLVAGGTPEAPAFSLISRGFSDEIGGNGNRCAEPGERLVFDMELADDGAPATGVSVDLTIDHPDIVVDVGHVELPDFQRGARQKISPGFQVTLAHGIAPGQLIYGDITVNYDGGSVTFRRPLYIGDGAWLWSDSIWILSDDNNDLHAGPGETVQFAPEFTNLGCATSETLVAELDIDDPWITEYGVKGNGEVPPVPVGSTVIPDRLFLAVIDPLTPHGHQVQCHVTLNTQAREEVAQFDLPLIIFDYTPPVVDMFQCAPQAPSPGDDVNITVRVRDGSGVQSVQGHIYSFDTAFDEVFEMFDDGNHQDGEAGDTIYGAQVTLPDADAWHIVDIVAQDARGMIGETRGIGGVTTVPFESSNDILVVCGADNDLALGLFTQALEDAGYGYDVWSHYRGIPPEDVLTRYADGAVIWFFTHTVPFLDKQERDAIDYYLAQGGNLLITEQDIGWFCVEEGTAESAEWYRDTLLAEYVADATSKRTVIGVEGDPVGANLEFSIKGGSGAQNQGWPSLIDPIAPAETCFLYKNYSGDSTGTAGLRAERSGAKHVYLAFGFEGIATQAERRDVMDAIMEWFGVSRNRAPRPWHQAPGWWIGPEIPERARYAASAFNPADMRIYRTGGLTVNNLVDDAIYFIDVVNNSSGDTGVKLQHPRFYHALAVLENEEGPRVYIVGGLDLQGQIVTSVEVYDPATNEISELSSDPFPSGVEGIPGSWAVLGNKLYITGIALLNAPYQTGDTYVFDPMAPEGEKWTKLAATLPHPRFFSGTAVKDGKIYLMGGISQESQSSIMLYSTVSVLDTTTEPLEWRDDVVPELPGAIAFAAGAALPDGANVEKAGTLFVMGSSLMTNESPAYLYDFDTGTWRNDWTFQFPRLLSSGLCTVPTARGPQLWLLGGHYYTNGSSGLIYGNTEILYPSTHPDQSYVGIRLNREWFTGGSTMTLYFDIAGDTPATTVDCYVALNVLDAWYFLTADPVFPMFTEEPLPFFGETALPADVTYSGLLFDIPIPEDIGAIDGAFYAATVQSGTVDLAGGLSWVNFHVR